LDGDSYLKALLTATTQCSHTARARKRWPMPSGAGGQRSLVTMDHPHPERHVCPARRPQPTRATALTPC
jgi:hypothetical protein